MLKQLDETLFSRVFFPYILVLPLEVFTIFSGRGTQCPTAGRKVSYLVWETEASWAKLVYFLPFFDTSLFLFFSPILSGVFFMLKYPRQMLVGKRQVSTVTLAAHNGRRIWNGKPTVQTKFLSRKKRNWNTLLKTVKEMCFFCQQKEERKEKR